MVRETRIGLDGWPAAISRTDGYQIVVAGPGTGKSEFLVRRIAHILETGGRPAEVVLLCFSRRAAATLRRRVSATPGGSAVDVTTFHSLALRLLEGNRDRPPPSPLTTPEQIAFVAGVLAEEDPASWPLTYRGILGTTAFAAEVADFLMRCSERLLTPEDLAALAETRADWRGLAGLYRRYLGRLDSAGRTDYGVLLATTVAMLRERPELSKGYRHVLVDEFQDTTPAQAEMSHLLARTHHNLTVAGDPLQSIYSFRGAELANIAGFSETHPDAERIVLTDSLRVPAEILEAALRVVSDVPGGAGPVTPAPHPGRCETYVFDQETAEAEWIASEVERAVVSENVPPSRIAVLVRSKREGLTELSRALDRRRIPHDPPQARLVDHPAVQLVHDIALAAVYGGGLRTTSAVDAASADRAMRRILLGPLVGLGLGQERSLLRMRRRTWEPWAGVVAERLPELPGLVSLLADHGWAAASPAAEGFWHLWSTLEGIDALVADADRSDWRHAWSAFAQALGRQTDRDPGITLVGYLALTENEDFEAEPMLTHHLTADRVALTTMHQAKGLEFDVVFIANATEGVFPDLRRSRRMLRPELLSPSRPAGDTQTFQLQEETRLAYTALTRARTRVVLTATDAAVDEGEKRPSRFLVAASGLTLEELGPPGEEVKDPVTLTEVETYLRRALLDPGAPGGRRIGAATILVRHRGRWWDPLRFAGVVPPGPDRPVLGPGVHLSPSQAEAYQTCPRKYVLEQRLRLGDTDTVYTKFGSLIHKVLERTEREVIGTGRRHAETDVALSVLDEVWGDADFGTPQLDTAWKRKGAELIERLYGNWPRSGPPLAVEQQVEMTIDDVDWRGMIDRLEEEGNGVAIVDFKTSTKAMGIEEAGVSVQLGFYALALESAGVPVVSAEFWYPRAPGKSIPTRSLDLSALDTVEDELRRVNRGILDEDWTPRVGTHCERCSFRTSCPAWPEGRGAFLP